MISIDRLQYSYKNTDKNILEGISHKFQEGKIILLTGPSGSGKSTFIHCLNGLNPKHYGGNLEGEIRVNDQNLNGLDIWHFSEKVGTVFQNPLTQFFHTIVEEELAFGLEFKGIESSHIALLIKNISKDLKIENLLKRTIFNLSSGEKQRVAIASVIIQNQAVLLFDEPTANLDIQGIQEFIDTINNLKNKGKVIIIADHRICYFCDIADSIYIINNKNLLKINKHDLKSSEFLANNDLRGSQIPEEHIPNKALGDKILEIKDIFWKVNKKVIIDIPKLDIYEGEILAIAGKNGSGKTSLAKIICGLNKRAKGKFTGIYNASKPSKILGKIGYVSQFVDQQLFSSSVKEEVKLSNITDAEAIKILKTFSIEKLADRHPHSLSGGEKQRTAIAASLSLKQKIIILDEPTSGLDGGSLYHLTQQLLELKQQGYTVIVITHDPELISMTASRILWLEKGRELVSISYQNFLKKLLPNHKII